MTATRDFGDLVKNHLKAAGFSQKILAHELEMNPSVLTHKLNRTGRYSLTYPEIHKIIKTLAKLEAITFRNQARELLNISGCPDFSTLDWQTVPLKNLESSPSERGFSSDPSRFKKEFGAAPLAGELPLPGRLKVNSFLTNLVGRGEEISELVNLIHKEQTRLITLTGPGGAGKTRLAMALTDKLLENAKFEERVFFCSLETTNNEDEIINQIGTTIGLKEHPGKTQLEALRAHLTNYRCLVILDNFEQLISSAALVVELLKNAPGLKLLVTSRIPLQLSFEHEFPVGPLALPSQDQLDLEPVKIEGFAAISLFLTRARAVNPAFYLKNDNKFAVAEICRKVDGLPLAIELAAARIRTIDPNKLLERLNLKTLVGGARDLPSRQQTIRKTIDWSYELLSEYEQILFTSLSIFVGGFTLEAAETILGDSIFSGVNIYNGIESLHLKNLLKRREDVSGTTRYTMLQTILEYGNEKLAQESCLPALEKSYNSYYLRLAREFDQKLKSPEQDFAMKGIDSEYDNFRNILFKESNKAEVTLETVQQVLELGSYLGYYWDLRSLISEGSHYLKRALDLSRNFEDKIDIDIRTNAINALTNLFGRQGEFNLASEYLQVSLDINRAGGNVIQVASILVNLALVWENLGDYPKARRFCEESLELFKQTGDKQQLVKAIYGLGWMYFWPGDNENGRIYLTQSLILAREINDKDTITFALNSLALLITYSESDFATAHRYCEEGLAMSQEIGSTSGVNYCLLSLGMITFAEGDFDQSNAYFEDCLKISRKIGDKRLNFYSLHYLGNIAYARQKFEIALNYFRDSLLMCKEINARSYLVFSLAGLAVVSLKRFELGPASGKIKALEEVVKICGVVDNLLTQTHLSLRPPELGYFREALEVGKNNLAESDFEANFSGGQVMTLDEVVAIIL